MPRTVGTQTLSSTFKQEDRTTCDLIAWVHWVFHSLMPDSQLQLFSGLVKIILKTKT
ncbi:uncharacterized protein PHALS_01400 [Plasmopara halstedii]|uniref:Uncharacterized protein n=1 Tax=Plasmopara halstedii TaxID=4781 RepID=A0A0P1AUH0_PLAHL|nr:uncharacterized protein PHALS_01400 [Plasmopara halstedii]CEG45074.1 hypothetical protein PHALS_01400 [Plasmopara halstedii]|eukprot:XP_024581443.1 hypothetical protein PHALS_01400 [Plasmopara halstedii]